MQIIQQAFRHCRSTFNFTDDYLLLEPHHRTCSGVGRIPGTEFLQQVDPTGSLDSNTMQIVETAEPSLVICKIVDL
jgi:hypothetical protein